MNLLISIIFLSGLVHIATTVQTETSSPKVAEAPPQSDEKPLEETKVPEQTLPTTAEPSPADTETSEIKSPPEPVATEPTLVVAESSEPRAEESPQPSSMEVRSSKYAKSGESSSKLQRILSRPRSSSTASFVHYPPLLLIRTTYGFTHNIYSLAVPNDADNLTKETYPFLGENESLISFCPPENELEKKIAEKFQLHELLFVHDTRHYKDIKQKYSPDSCPRPVEAKDFLNKNKSCADWGKLYTSGFAVYIHELHNLPTFVKKDTENTMNSSYMIINWIKNTYEWLTGYYNPAWVSIFEICVEEDGSPMYATYEIFANELMFSYNVKHREINYRHTDNEIKNEIDLFYQQQKEKHLENGLDYLVPMQLVMYEDLVEENWQLTTEHYSNTFPMFQKYGEYRWKRIGEIIRKKLPYKYCDQVKIVVGSHNSENMIPINGGVILPVPLLAWKVVTCEIAGYVQSIVFIIHNTREETRESAETVESAETIQSHTDLGESSIQDLGDSTSPQLLEPEITHNANPNNELPIEDNEVHETSNLSEMTDEPKTATVGNSHPIPSNFSEALKNNKEPESSEENIRVSKIVNDNESPESPSGTETLNYCPNICTQNGWHEINELGKELGDVYCCNVYTFRDVFNAGSYINFKVDQVLDIQVANSNY